MQAAYSPLYKQRLGSARVFGAFFPHRCVFHFYAAALVHDTGFNKI